MAAPYGGQRTPQTSIAIGNTATTPTAAQFIDGRFISDASPSGILTFTIPDATLLIAALPNASAGDTFVAYIDNQLNTFARTLVPGTGNTLTGSTNITAGQFARVTGMVRSVGGNQIALLRGCKTP